MFGLRMARQYLDEILSGEKTFDARCYDTDKRGTIALIDTSSKKILPRKNTACGTRPANGRE